jgi:hypothetical protein
MIAEKLTATKTAALTTWATWKTADSFAATLKPLTDAVDASKAAGAAGELKAAITELEKLTAEGTKVSTANTAWATAKSLYTTTLADQNKALAAKKDYGTANASLVSGSSTDTLAQAKLNQAALAKSITAMEKLRDYQIGVKTRADAALLEPKALQMKREADLLKAQRGEIYAAAAVKLAQEGCHTEAFKDAQADRKAAAAAKAVIDAAKAKVAADYKAKAAMPAAATSDVTAGGLCTWDDATKKRPTCKEDKAAPLCCGAAQRFLKDGTKLTVETCQLATATTYTYYPVMATGAAKAPTPETWRFQCISAAHKLAAAATAALAAGYMMA